MTAATLTVHCICALWCDTCTAFRPLFDAVAADMPGHRFAWHILEDLEERFPDIEVETFPTLLVADASGEPRFVGPILPQAGALRQIVASAAHGALASPALCGDWAPVTRQLQAQDTP